MTQYSDKLLGVLVDFYKGQFARAPMMDEYREFARQDYDDLDAYIDNAYSVRTACKLHAELYDFVYGTGSYDYFINTWRK